MDGNITITINVYWLAAIILLGLILGRRWRKPMIHGTGERYVLITGCDRGFGQRAALSLSSKCHVIAGCLTKEGCRKLKDAELSRITPISMDVTDMRSIENAYHQVQSIIPQNKGLWGLVNNAGLSGKIGPIDWLHYEDITHVINVNIMGVIMTTKVFLPLLKSSRGRIVNTSSILGKFNLPYNGVYSMTKHAVESFSDSLRLEMAPFGVRVVLVEPGTHMTDFVNNLDKLVHKAWHDLPTHVQVEYGDKYQQQMAFLGTRLIPLLGWGSRVENVVNAYEHALLSAHPKTRYLVGLDAQLIDYFTLLPSWLTDTLLSLPGIRAIPASCQTHIN